MLQVEMRIRELAALMCAVYLRLNSPPLHRRDQRKTEAEFFSHGSLLAIKSNYYMMFYLTCAQRNGARREPKGSVCVRGKWDTSVPGKPRLSKSI